MSLDTADLPSDPDALRAFALACQAELRAAKAAVRLTRLEIEKLKMHLARLRRMQFGQSSERLARQIEQFELQLEDLEGDDAQAEAVTAPPDAASTPAAQEGRGVPKRRPLPDHLPRQEVMHEPDTRTAAGCTCPACGAGMSRLGEDVTEVLDYVPGRFQVLRHVRPKYACQRCDHISQAAAPNLPIPRGRPSPALLAHVLVAKYGDHLPLYRQSAIYARDGVDLDRSTLADWVGQAAWLLAPVVDGIRAHVFAADKIHGDDTPVPVLAPGTGKTRTGRLWVYVRDDRPFQGTAPPAAAYFYSPDRKGERPRDHLRGYTGFLQADGYAGFEELYEPGRTKPGPIIEVACWAHSRRKVFDVWQATASPVAKEALDRIAVVYAIEAAARGKPAEERRALRVRTRPLLDEFFTWAQSAATRLSGKSALAEAFRYILKRRAALTRFLDDGRLEADNNRAENSLRAIALGRKNWTFAGSDTGGERAASLYTLIETAKLNGLDPEAYLRDALARIADGHPINRITELMPWVAAVTPPS
ncbi:IS66 family transposase [Nitrospirillum viridazoti]|uniref:IS66 family transposase n=1 Tax=Nitrospirillum viridazoti CBAmc TaxID=1441467 RepID=A0A248JZ90_9PROT|nr:IS66 family transposase [Nitrospirillum amazonense]ASG24025.1 IS66 family transposase [Nitrospirillum amazonense CBAmc]TWB26061.1 transposase [Nitrospirillum amazonense]